MYIKKKCNTIEMDRLVVLYWYGDKGRWDREWKLHMDEIKKHPHNRYIVEITDQNRSEGTDTIPLTTFHRMLDNVDEVVFHCVNFTPDLARNFKESGDVYKTDREKVSFYNCYFSAGALYELKDLLFDCKELTLSSCRYEASVYTISSLVHVVNSPNLRLLHIVKNDRPYAGEYGDKAFAQELEQSLVDAYLGRSIKVANADISLQTFDTPQSNINDRWDKARGKLKL